MAKVNYDKMTVEQLEKVLDDYDKERMVLKEEARKVMEIRNRKINEEQLDHWGLTQEEYDKCKELATANGIPTHQALNMARTAKNKAARNAQSFKVEAVVVGVKAKQPGEK